MIKKRDIWWWHKSNAALREVIAHGYFKYFFSSVVVTEYPKSGGTWLSQMLSEVTGMPYARNRYPVFTDSILHGCWLNPDPDHKTVVLFRDGRDVLASYYYHLVYPKEITSAKYSAKVREKTLQSSPENVHKNLCSFIEWAFDEGFPGWTWSDFIDRWWEDDTNPKSSYEKLTQNTLEELTRILDELSIPIEQESIAAAIEKFSFENQSGRSTGQVDQKSFVRKGIVGDWVNCFDRDSARLFNTLAGDQLIKAGYETNDDWVYKVE